MLGLGDYESSDEEETPAASSQKRKMPEQESPRKKRKANEYPQPQAPAFDPYTAAMQERDMLYSSLYDEFLNPKEEEIVQEVEKTPEKEQPENSDDPPAQALEPNPSPAEIPIQGLPFCLPVPGQGDVGPSDGDAGPPVVVENPNSAVVPYEDRNIRYIPTQEELALYADLNTEETVTVTLKRQEEPKETEEERQKKIVVPAGVCVTWARTGHCQKGESCKFKHMEKSNSCWEWEMNGVCQYGASCIFIHGIPDACRQWESLGICRFGDKCRFRHDKKFRKW